MDNKAQLNNSELKIQRALGLFLGSRENWGDPAKHRDHVDEDVITAFVEGNLKEKEAKPVVSHLVDCSYCLQVSAELIRLQDAFAEEAVQPLSEVPQEKVGILSGVLAKIFGSAESAVFAHEEKDESAKDDSEEE